MTSHRRSLGSLAKQIAPYLIAVAALSWVFHQTDLQQFVGAIRRAPMTLFVLMCAVLVLVNAAADTFAMARVFAWFGCHVPYKDLYLVRGATYLLAVVNYHVGQAAIVGYLYRARKVPFFRATGWILFIIGINVGTLFLLASAGASTVSEELKLLRIIPWVCAVGVVVYGALLVIKPPILARRSLFSPLFEMGIRGHVKGVLVRLPHIGVLMFWHYLALRMFDIRVPPTTALVYLPAYFAVATLPVNVNGLGVAQAVAVAFFGPYAVLPEGVPESQAARGAAVIAYSISIQGLSILLQLLMGVVCLRRATALGLTQASSAQDGGQQDGGQRDGEQQDGGTGAQGQEAHG